MEPIQAVLFDYHQTLVNAGRAREWIDAGWQRLGRDATASRAWGDRRANDITEYLAHVWSHIGHDLDPDDRRDLDESLPPKLFAQAMREVLDDEELIEALYAEMLDNWVPYDDVVPTLRALRERGVRTALLSNIGIDITPSLAHHGVLPLLDAVVLSYQVGSKKPEPGIFEHALRTLDVPASATLMVGDSWRHDAAAAGLGIRTLVLPRTEGDVHGLDIVVRMVGA